MRFFLFLFLAMLSRPLSADEIPFTIEGDWIQGGLLIGETTPGSKLSIDGRDVRVNEKGEFAFGLHRDAAPEIVVTWQMPGESAQKFTKNVTQRAYDIQRIDGLPPRKVNPNPDDLKRIASEKKKMEKARNVDSDLAFFRDKFIWPAAGRKSGVYGSQRILNGEAKNPHLGFDIAAPIGTPIVAAADGVAVLVAPDMFYNGNTVLLDHGMGVKTLYIHMNDIQITEGETVKQGQQIGTIGQTGRATGPHLHWGIAWFSTWLDPELILGDFPNHPAEPQEKE